jgi:GT2 family glycosyltransferase
MIDDPVQPLKLPVSVVIPTHNRLPVLRKCLAALAVQRYPSECMEVIVVADGCSDGTERALEDAEFPFALRVLSQPASGAAAARNRGAQAARGDLLIFIDDDVIATPGLVEAHVRVHSTGEERVAVGPYLLEPVQNGSFISEQVYDWWKNTFDAMADPDFDPDYRSIVGGNLSIERKIFFRTGEFNTSFKHSKEDLEFGSRLLRDGVQFIYVPEAHAAHVKSSNILQSFNRTRRSGSADVLLADLHPSVLPTLQLVRPQALPQWLAFRAPRLSEPAVRIATLLLAGADRLKARGLWLRLKRRINHYWYWRGVADEVGSAKAWKKRLADLQQANRQQAETLHRKHD